jgi:amino acid transporter
MNFVSGIPVLFGWVLYTGGPTAAFANWTMVGGLSFVVSLSMAEIAAALPTAGGIYYWAYRLGGTEWGQVLPYIWQAHIYLTLCRPFLAWMTGWWNWAGWVRSLQSQCNASS